MASRVFYSLYKEWGESMGRDREEVQNVIEKDKLQDSINNIPFVITSKNKYRTLAYTLKLPEGYTESVNRAYLCGNVTAPLGWGEEGTCTVL